MLPFLNTQASPEPSGASGKVELDLDDAPFLEPDPPEPEEEQAGADDTSVPATAAAGEKETPPKKSRKKLALILAGAGVVLFLGALAAAYFVFLKDTTPPEPEPEVEVVVIPSTPPELPVAPVSKFNISWPPFWVEVKDPEGEVRFIYCKFTLVTDNQRIAYQVTNKNTVLRDAVYYYLRNKEYSFLADLRQLDVLKSEVLNIINYYILPEQTYTRPPEGEAPAPVDPDAPVEFEKVGEVLIEEYLIK